MSICIYKAVCACYGGAEEEEHEGFQTERKHTLTFQGENAVEAVRDALRWYRNRTRCYPELFYELWSIKVFKMLIAPVDADGRCQSGPTPPFFEWKHDWIDTLEEKIQDLEKKEATRNQDEN